MLGDRRQRGVQAGYRTRQIGRMIAVTPDGILQGAPRIDVTATCELFDRSLKRHLDFFGGRAMTGEARRQRLFGTATDNDDLFP
ncbi:hypothetical protein [Sphingomonas mollis]|uniref:hypothetical protein n=1 Tax=Sphingomonas mollis TaxID=2795726 RepID=UPI001E5794C4|nr:hypothetical protein [Sphingomonas sp. BT553]